MAVKIVPSIDVPQLKITLGDGWPISADTVESFEFVVDEDKHLPRCVIRYTDPGERRVGMLGGMGIGSEVNFTIMEDNVANPKKSISDSLTSYKLCPLSIAKLHSTTGTDMTAQVELLCEHPWKIFKDFSSHAYYNKKNSDIIKDLIENAEGRGFNFEDLDGAEFFDSSDDGKIPRYKCGEGDYDFIVNHILPYTVINDEPAVFWVDEVNHIHLDSFRNMYSNEAKAVLFMGDEASLTDDVTAKGASTDGLAFVSSKTAKIGSDNEEKMISVLKPDVSIDDIANLLTYTGHLLPKIALGKYKKGMADKAHVPVELKAMAVSDATDKKFYRNHPFDDLKAVALHEQSIFNSMFTIELDSTFCGNFVHTGDNVELVIPPDTTAVPATKSWMNGKWHVRAMRYIYDKGNHMYTCKLTLIRPSFNLNKLTTGVSDLDEFYAVGMAGL